MSIKPTKGIRKIMQDLWGMFLAPREQLDEEAIVNDLIEKLGPADREWMLKHSMEDARGLHHSWGMHIRNHYGLWAHKFPEVDYDHADSPMFPDQISDRIIRKVWCRLHNTEWQRIEGFDP